MELSAFAKKSRDLRMNIIQTIEDTKENAQIWVPYQYSYEAGTTEDYALIWLREGYRADSTSRPAAYWF